MIEVAACLLMLLQGADPQPGKYFKIAVVDEQTGRGVPLVELRTVNNIRYYTDSNGIVAFHELGLMDQTVFFYVQSHGYEFAKDGFGFRGKALKVTEGGSAKLSIKRINIAERLYRITGSGIYRDSVLLGHRPPIKEPLLNGQVFGQDSVVTAVFEGKLHWFWGDTSRPAYPLGNFHVPGATSALPAKGGLDPEKGVDLSYFLDEKGFAKPTAHMPGDGPTWIGGLVTLRDNTGRERLFAGYVKVRGLLNVYARGLAEWNDGKKQFDKVAEFPMDAPAYPNGHPFLHTDHGIAYVYFPTPYPLVRVRADPELLKHLKSYESFTCLKAGSRGSDNAVDRDEGGAIRYSWKRNTPPVDPNKQNVLIKKRLLKPEEGLLQLRDVDTGQSILGHSGSVSWNEYRQRWVMIALQSFGTSFLGEVWYAEADTPIGPWVYARKIVTHDKYSFYNPKHHPYFDKEKGRLLFFEGTYSHTFSGNSEPTPRYDYNQIMYKLDLADPRLALPVPIYQLSETASHLGARPRLTVDRKLRPIAFFALDRPVKGSVPVYEWETNHGRVLKLDAPPSPKNGKEAEPLFSALPADTKRPPATAAPLYEFVHKQSGARAYSTESAMSGYKQTERPLCLVWRTPMQVKFP